MSFFGNAKDAPPAVTGESVLRQSLRIKFRHGPSVAANLARDLNIGVGASKSWASGSGQLPVATLNTIAKRIFGDTASYDPTRDLLVRTGPVATPLGISPPRYVPPPRPAPPPAPPPVHPAPPPALPELRPGWAKD